MHRRCSLHINVQTFSTRMSHVCTYDFDRFLIIIENQISDVITEVISVLVDVTKTENILIVPVVLLDI